MGLTSITDEVFLRRLRRGDGDGRFQVRIAGGKIPVRMNQRRSLVLIVVFAGAIDQAKRELPQFGPQFVTSYVPASVIGIADPSLPVSTVLQSAWYAGHEGFETQRILPGFIQRVAEACGAERIILLGGSAGGFAALHTSWCLPGSVAIVFNPQTDLDRYDNPHKWNYRRICWPLLGDDEPLSNVIASRLPDCYAERFENQVIYLQNASDALHVREHFAPYLAAIPLAAQHRLLARAAYWGRDGHKPPPPPVWLAWLKAAIDAPSPSALDIQTTRDEQASPDVKLVDPLVSYQDYRLAEAISSRAR